MAFDKMKILPDREALARYTADWLLDTVANTTGPIAIALAGGSTPQRLYEILAEPACRNRLRWRDTHWFWGDERYVPYHDPRSNHRMANEALLAHVPVPAANVHAVPTAAGSPADAAGKYTLEMQRYYGTARLDPTRPFFDVVLLGLGDDGHTASLFPGTSALKERQRWVVAFDGVQPEPRITLTYPLLNSCRNAVFLVAGSTKRSILQRLHSGDPTLPATGIHPHGQLYCFADAAAAGTEK